MNVADVFGLPQNEEENIILPNVVYGYAFYNGKDGSWDYRIGPFPFLYGVYQGYQTMIDKMEGLDDIEEAINYAHGFFFVDQQYNPFRIINRVKLDQTMQMYCGIFGLGKPPTVTLVDLTTVDTDMPIPPMEFEY